MARLASEILGRNWAGFGLVAACVVARGGGGGGTGPQWIDVGHSKGTCRER